MLLHCLEHGSHVLLSKDVELHPLITVYLLLRNWGGGLLLLLFVFFLFRLDKKHQVVEMFL